MDFKDTWGGSLSLQCSLQGGRQSLKISRGNVREQAILQGG